jgi:hypothetical protein
MYVSQHCSAAGLCSQFELKALLQSQLSNQRECQPPMDSLLEASLDTSCFTLVQHAQALMLDILKLIEVRAKRKKKVNHWTLKQKKRRAFDCWSIY